MLFSAKVDKLETYQIGVAYEPGSSLSCEEYFPPAISLSFWNWMLTIERIYDEV